MPEDITKDLRLLLKNQPWIKAWLRVKIPNHVTKMNLAPIVGQHILEFLIEGKLPDQVPIRSTVVNHMENVGLCKKEASGIVSGQPFGVIKIISDADTAREFLQKPSETLLKLKERLGGRR
jgi:hypothetical protein